MQIRANINNLNLVTTLHEHYKARQVAQIYYKYQVTKQ